MEKFTAEIIPVNSRVVVDRNAVTSQGPATAIEYALALVEQLYGKEKSEEVAGPLVSYIACKPSHTCFFLLLSAMLGDMILLPGDDLKEMFMGCWIFLKFCLQ
jgi:hypothetical protein